MELCPICEKEAKCFRMFGKSGLEEIIIQCNDCHYMKREIFKNFELRVGRWHKVIRYYHDRKAKRKSDNDMKAVMAEFQIEIDKAKKRLCNKENCDII